MKRLAWVLIVSGLTVAAVRRLRREARPAWPCALRGHSDVLVFGTAGKLFLRCGDCGKQTPGWALAEKETA